MLVLCIFLFFHSALANVIDNQLISENAIIFDLINTTDKLSVNGTVLKENLEEYKQVSNEPEPQQHIQRSVNRDSNNFNDTLQGNLNNVTFISDFKPSLPMETFYEHNKFTVPPALPEPKISNHNDWNEKSNVPLWMEKQSPPNPWQNSGWKQDLRGADDLGAKSTSERPSTNVKFPSSSYERPYTFVGPNNALSHSATTEQYSIKQSDNIKPEKRTQGFWSKLMDFGSHVPERIQQTFSEYNLMEKPHYYNQYPLPYKDDQGYAISSHSGYGSSGYGGYISSGHSGFGSSGHGHGYGSGGHVYVPKTQAYGFSGHGGYGGHGGGFGVGPWKKVIKFLATVIPIGLFLSALAPTIIQVQSVNDTVSTYRNEDSKEELAKRFASSLSYFNKLGDEGCEDKVLCELLVSASLSKNSEENIKNLLDNFVKSEDLQNKKEDLMRIFDAVRNQDCKPIICKSIKEPS